MKDAAKEIIIDGLTIRYHEAGSGKTVILLHGWGANKESMAPISHRLEGMFHVVCPDLPGAGASDEPASPWDASAYSAFLEKFFQKLDIRPFAAIGHSNGGRILIRACSDWFHPAKLVLIDSAGLRKKHGPLYYIKVYSYKLGKKVLSFPLLRSTGLYERLLKNAGSADYRAATPVMRATMSRLLAEDLKPCLPAIGAETLLIWGTCDTATPLSDGKTMEKLIPDAGLVEISGAGHFSYLDNFAKAGGAIDYFLTH